MGCCPDCRFSYLRVVHRILALLLVVVGVAPGTWWRVPPEKRIDESEIVVQPLALPSPAALAPHLGPFELEKAWQLRSRHRWFGGYSALFVLDTGKLVALSDGGFALHMTLPDPALAAPRPEKLFPPMYKGKARRDIEAATYDPETSTLWLALENTNAIPRFTQRGGKFAINGVAVPLELSRWSGNAGPESFLRLEDGRFIALRESFTGHFEDRRHAALLFATDPVEDREAQRFSVAGPAGFSPTDAAQMPDGRVLILFRKLVWPVPARFAGRIAIADPAKIKPGQTWAVKEVAKLSSSLPVDNFEGLAVEPRADGRITVWLVSDGNNSIFQRTLLWKLAVDPEDLP